MPLDPPSREARALHLVGIIYEASIHPDSWAEFVRELSIEFGDAAVALSLEIPGLPLQRHAYRAHLDERFTFEFAKHLARDLPWGSLMQPQFTKGFARGSEFYANDQLPQTEFYKTWMRPQGLSPEGPIGHTIWKKDGKAMAGIAIYRRIGGRPFEEEDVAMANLLVPHLSRSYSIYRHLRGHELLGGLYELTPAERDLAFLLCEGKSLEEAAAARDVKRSTARTQLKSIFQKTGTSRQSELIRLALSGAARSED